MKFMKQCAAASIAFAIGAAAAAEGSRPGDKPLVANGDLSLSTLDFDAYMERVPPQLRDEFRAEDSKVNPTVDALWVRRVLATRARRPAWTRIRSWRRGCARPRTTCSPRHTSRTSRRK
jgi:hypothetical protein